MGSIISNLTQGLDFLKYLNPLDEDFILNGLINFFNPNGENFIFSGLFSDITGIFDGLVQVLDWLNPLSENFFVYKLLDLLSDLLNRLFVPSQDSFLRIQETFKSKFGFIDSINIAISSIKDMLNDVSGAPKLTFNVDTKIYKGEIVALDLSFYKPYKAYGDLIFTGFAYLFFFYRIFVHLPAIINGQASVVDIVMKRGKDE